MVVFSAVLSEVLVLPVRPSRKSTAAGQTKFVQLLRWFPSAAA